MIPLLVAALLTFTPPSDADLTANVLSEKLPQQGLSYTWERFRMGLQRAFTFNVNKKAELYEQHVHQLDRKLAACTEQKNLTCADLIQSRLTALQNRAEQFMEKHADLHEKHLEQFKAWRGHMQQLLEELKAKGLDPQRIENREHLIELRSQNLKNKLDDTRQKVQLKQQEFNTSLEQ